MLIDRPEYLERLKSFRDQNLIKVVTGVRRCGKSTLFELYINYLKETGVSDEQIVRINFDDPTYQIGSARELYNFVVEQAADEGKTYVFLDEVQMVPDFQIAVNGLRARENFDVYITGSNAYLLSGELATLLSGRYIEIHMLPLSFREYVAGLYPGETDIEVLKRRVNLRAVFEDYLNFGGLPQTLDYYEKRDGAAVPRAAEIGEYIENIFGTIVYKDIMSRHGVTDRALLERVVRFVLDNVGQPLSIKKVVDTLNGNYQKTSYHTIENYVTALCECFLIYRAERYDIRGRELLTTGYKYFVADTGLRNFVTGRGAVADVGQLIENVVYLELLRRRERVRVGKFDNLEVDFVTGGASGMAGGGVTSSGAGLAGRMGYYQVTKDALSEETFRREVAPLLGIKDNYPKYLLTLDGGVGGDLAGVEQVDLVGWLVRG